MHSLESCFYVCYFRHLVVVSVLCGGLYIF